MDKEKLIAKIIFGVEDLSEISLPVSEEVRQNFEIAWDIWENFQKIKENAEKNLLFKFLEKLKDKVEEELPIKEHGFKVFMTDPKLKSSDCKSPPCGGLYISKPEWLQDNNDRGIYSIAVEKWGKFFIGIIRNKEKNKENFNISAESEIIKILQSLKYETDHWFIGLVPIDSDPYFNFKHENDKEFYLEKLLSDYNNLLEKTFFYIKKVYEDLTGNEDLLNLFEEAVKERKEELNKQKEKTGQLSSDGGT